VAEPWRVLSEDPDERRLFAAPGAWSGLPSAPAGPRNRLRSVQRVGDDARHWYVKTFAATQWKNRLRFVLTAPRARDDAERELGVTLALREAGSAAPRPVACGRDRNGAAYYVCAPLAGEPLADLLRRGAVDDALARRVAAHCGALLRAGFSLPDLSADHVFVDGETLAVLDLHNGAVTAPGPAPAQLCRRVLRRFARSVRELPVPWPAALRFAVRLLRAAGRGGDARAILRRLPPFTTAERYEATGKAGAYATRNPVRHARELLLLERVFPGRPGETVLDLPCGAGRLSPWLQQRGCAVVAADGALAMLQQAGQQQTGLPRAVLADALAMPFADRAVDGVVTFRFLHHLTDELSDRVIAEACRVAGRFVVVSFFHPCSAHHLQRRLRALAGGRTTRFARTLGAIDRTFAKHGFRRLRAAADLPFARDLWLASFARDDSVNSADPLRRAP